jgi:Na+-driven multidrug efflux pump
MLGYSFAVAATSLVGQRIGAGEKQEDERYGWLSMAFGIVVMGLIALVFLVIPQVLMGFLSRMKGSLLWVKIV